jgi:hypothetical protein
MMPEINPYESPKTESGAETVPLGPDGRSMVVREALQLAWIGVLFGAFLGMLACGLLSGGRAAFWFYPFFGVFGAVVGLLDSVFGVLLIAIMRLASRATKGRPTIE